MKRVAICNVGERDVRYHAYGQFLAFDKNEGPRLAGFLGCKKGARYIAERILEIMQDQGRKTLKGLRFPIIEPFLEHVIENHGPIDPLVLVVTNQERAEERFRARDTINAGRVLEHLVRYRFWEEVKEIRMLEVHSRPHLIEEGYKFFGSELPRIIPPEEQVEVHLLTGGGIPALNYGLAWKALSLYGEACHLYQVQEPLSSELLAGGRGGQVKPADMLTIHRDMILRTAMDLVEHYDYHSTLAVLEGVSQRLPQQLLNPIRSAVLSLDLNFEEAAEQLAPLQGEDAHLASRYRLLKNPNFFNLLMEMYWVASIRHEEGSYSDLLWRTAAFYENALRLIALGGTGMLDMKSQDKWPISKIKDRNPGLYEYLENSQKVSRTDDSWWANKHLLEEVCQYVCRVEEKEKWVEVYSHVRLLENLWSLRNRMLHSLEGIRRDTISQWLEVPDSIRKEIRSRLGVEKVDLLIPLMGQIVSCLGKLMGRQVPQENPYNRINGYILERLREMMI